MSNYRRFEDFKENDLQSIREMLWKLRAANNLIYRSLDEKINNSNAAMDYKEIDDLQKMIEVQADYINSAFDLINPFF